MTNMLDVLVVGGGPAGATVALCLARQGLRVALLESSSYDRPRFGETLPPEINPLLRGLDLWDKFAALRPLEAPGMISTWGNSLPTESDFIGSAHGTGWHIDRAGFDRMLSGEAEKAGVQTVCTRAEACRENGHWCAGGLRARFLVDASGRNGLRIDGHAEREIDDELLSIVLVISFPGESARDLRTCVESTPAGWWYTAPVPGGNLIAMFFTDAEVYSYDGIAVGEQLRAAPLTARRLQGGHIGSSRVLHVSSSCRKRLHGEDWVAVGDSASSYDPLSGRGVFKALRHGEAAAASIAALLRGDEGAMARYAAQVRSEYNQYVRQRRSYYAGERRWAESRFWGARRVTE